MNYIQKLKESSQRFKSIVCMGLDPVIEDIPISTGSVKERIFGFYESILNAMIRSNEYPAAVKPNYAFYAQYGFEGLEALVSVINIYKSQGLPLILDAKRGDIAKTAAAYAKECFEFFNADAVTLSPYMGYDSIAPFIDNYPDKGCYILNKTSNKGSEDFQDIIIDGKPLFIHVTEKIAEWHRPGIGAVVGATYPEQLRSVAEIFINLKKDAPLLIPGIGSQGGDLRETVSVLKRFPDIAIHRINSSSGINYAYKKNIGMHFADASVEEIKRLNQEINNFK